MRRSPRMAVGGPAVVALLVAIASCKASGPAPGGAPAPVSTPRTDRQQDDTLAQGLVPAGFGTLRQDDIAIRLQPQGVLIKAIPLDESVLRVLAPDSYRALRDLVQSKRPAIDEVARRHGGGPLSLWYVSFNGVEAEARFSPMELLISSAGRDFRPLDVLPLTSGFGEQRLRARDTQSAVYIFDGAVNPAQPLRLGFQAEQSSAWEDTLQRIERERALIRSRAGRPKS